MPSATPSTRLARLARAASLAASSSLAAPPKPGFGDAGPPKGEAVAPGGGGFRAAPTGGGGAPGCTWPERAESAAAAPVEMGPPALRLLISCSRTLAAAAIRAFLASRSSHSTLYRCAFSSSIAKSCSAAKMRSGSGLPPWTSSASQPARSTQAVSAAEWASRSAWAAVAALVWKAPRDSLKAGTVSDSTRPDTCLSELLSAFTSAASSAHTTRAAASALGI
mmetsp:Transcript_14389/g.47035  ORF Transcript_14389/g.47035 Transcript_14389/m.47035 type:complete len:222 (+) Transcript_14389:828-1493(+)